MIKRDLRNLVFGASLAAGACAAVKTGTVCNYGAGMMDCSKEEGHVVVSYKRKVQADNKFYCELRIKERRSKTNVMFVDYGCDETVDMLVSEREVITLGLLSRKSEIVKNVAYRSEFKDSYDIYFKKRKDRVEAGIKR